MQPIMELCEEAEQRPGAQVLERWWEQEGINLARERATVETALETEVEETDGEAREGRSSEAGM